MSNKSTHTERSRRIGITMIYIFHSGLIQSIQFKTFIRVLSIRNNNLEWLSEHRLKSFIQIFRFYHCLLKIKILLVDQASNKWKSPEATITHYFSHNPILDKWMVKRITSRIQNFALCQELSTASTIVWHHQNLALISSCQQQRH